MRRICSAPEPSEQYVNAHSELLLVVLDEDSIPSTLYPRHFWHVHRHCEHPFLLRLEDDTAVGDKGANPTYMGVFEFYEHDCSLAEWMYKQAHEGETNGGSEAIVLRVFLRLALALHGLHQRHLVHGNVTAHNCFLSEANDPTSVKLGFVDWEGVPTGIRNLNGIITSQRHQLPPEMWSRSGSGTRSLSTAGDIWMLGCTMHWLLTLRPLFKSAKGVVELRSMILDDSRAKEWDTQYYSQELVSVVGEMLATEPLNRPSLTELLRRPLFQAELADLATSDVFLHRQVASLGNVRSHPLRPLAAVDEDEILKEGYVLKNSDMQWKDRYLTLRKNRITLSLAIPGKPTALRDLPTSAICNVLPVSQQLFRRPFVFVLNFDSDSVGSSKHPTALQASSTSDRDEWIAAFRRVMEG